MSPDFYKEHRKHLKDLCNLLQAFYERKLLKQDNTPYLNFAISIPPRLGKAIQDDVPVLTTKGFKKHGELNIGDYVYGYDGLPKQITATQNSYIHECSEIFFDTHESIICSKEHEWQLEMEYDDKKGRRTEILETQNIYKRKSRRSPAIRLAQPLINNDVILPIEPYLLGIWLGDGESKAGWLSCGEEDIKHFEKYGELKRKDKTAYRIKLSTINQITLKFDKLFKNKHIPEAYFNASYNQRLALLQGLMDTDGCVMNDGSSCEFCNINKRLAEDVWLLCRTLGIKSTIHEYSAKLYGRYISQKYRVFFTPSFNIEIFRLQRKQNRINNKKSKDQLNKKRFFIRNIKDCGLQTVKCITVEGGIYLVGNGLIPTHNSRTLELFSIWIFGRNQSEKIMTVTYNEFLSVQFSKSVRDKILCEQTPELKTVKDVFPNLSIKTGSGASHLWALEGQHLSYLGGSPGGTLTGIGATVLIIDDLIKNAIEALNARILQEHWDFYNNTLRQRLEEGHIKIVNFTRWATDDLIGRLIKEKPGEWFVYSLEAMNESTNEMLCSDLLSFESYQDIKKGMMKEIFFANYHQKPMDIEGRLYKSLKTYSERPIGTVKNYTDTADEGNCYLCSIDYIEYKKEAYIINVLYTGAGMEVTEKITAEMLINDKVNVAMIESNNGGKGFARAVVREMQEQKNNRTVVKWFHQSKNKDARIISNSAWVQEHIYFPLNWSELWSEFYKDVNSYTKDGKGQKQDAPDVLTGIAEQFEQGGLRLF